MISNRKAGLFVLLAVFFFTLAPLSGSNLNKIDAADGNIYWGAHLYGKPPEAAAFQPGGNVHFFENNISRKGMPIIAWGAPWEYAGAMLRFQTSYFNNVRNHGSIPMVDWGSFNPNLGPNQPKFKLSNIARGDFDNFIVQWALDAKAWGHPFFLRFNWEMNGNWQFPWSAQLNGNTAADYVAAWRRVHNIFTNVGATNATWIWAPNISTWNTLPMAQVYPGAAFVDWIALDGYNYAGYQGMPWLYFSQIFSGDKRVVPTSKDSIAEITALAPGKPMMIAEVASVEAGDGGLAKSIWITNLFSNVLINNYPQIKAVIWFHWADGGMSWPLGTSYQARDAFSAAINKPIYLANSFANLGPGKIPARR